MHTSPWIPPLGLVMSTLNPPPSWSTVHIPAAPESGLTQAVPPDVPVSVMGTVHNGCVIVVLAGTGNVMGSAQLNGGPLSVGSLTVAIRLASPAVTATRYVTL